MGVRIKSGFDTPPARCVGVGIGATILRSRGFTFCRSHCCACGRATARAQAGRTAAKARVIISTHGANTPRRARVTTLVDRSGRSLTCNRTTCGASWEIRCQARSHPVTSSSRSCRASRPPTAATASAAAAAANAALVVTVAVVAAAVHTAAAQAAVALMARAVAMVAAPVRAAAVVTALAVAQAAVARMAHVAAMEAAGAGAAAARAVVMPAAAVAAVVVASAWVARRRGRLQRCP